MQNASNDASTDTAIYEVKRDGIFYVTDLQRISTLSDGVLPAAKPSLVMFLRKVINVQTKAKQKD